MTPSPEEAHWEQLAELFDTLADLPADARAARLAELRARSPELAADLARMLEADASDGPLDHTVPQPSVEPEPVPDRSSERIGPYRLLRLVGRGGMGEVYLAERADGGFQQRVALKLVKRGMDTDALLRRFMRERRILAQLEHPHIARLLDGGAAADNTPYLAMEYVEGSSITEHASAAALPVRERVSLLLGAVDAVAHAQARLVVHRDLKPSNILVGTDGRARVLDFGIATLLDDSEEALTGTGARILSPAYAAPEQVRGEPVTTATDVYALGGVLFELLTGREPHPHRGSSPTSWLAALGQETAERPSVVVRRSRERGTTQPGSSQERLARELRGDLDTIVLTALHMDPARRYAGAAQLAQDLRRWLEGRPIAARPDTAGYRLRKFVARHRLGVGSASAVLLALIAGFGIALWQASVARDQALRADAAARRAELVTDFVLSLYGEQDPVSRAQAAARTPRQLVAAGMERARRQLAGEPALLNDVLGELARVQVALGDAAAAQPVLAAVLEARIASHGEDSPEAALAAIDLAAAELPLGGYASAATRLDAALARLPDDAAHALERARAGTLRAQAVQMTQGSAAAVPIMQAAHAELARFHGPDHPETLSALASVGAVLEGADRLDEAEATFRETIARLESSLGPDHARLVVPLASLSDILRRHRRYDEARPLIERSIAIARAQLPSPHPLVGGALMRLGDLLRRMGDLDAAEKALDEAAVQLPAGAPQHAQITLFRGGLARARDNHGAAADLYGQAHREFLAALGPDNVFPWMAATQQGLSLVQAGRLEEAESVLAAARARQEAVTGAESPDTADAMGAQAQLRIAQGREEEAVPLLERAVAIRSALFGDDDPGTVDLQQRLDALR